MSDAFERACVPSRSGVFCWLLLLVVGCLFCFFLDWILWNQTGLSTRTIENNVFNHYLVRVITDYGKTQLGETQKDDVPKTA